MPVQLRTNWESPLKGLLPVGAYNTITSRAMAATVCRYQECPEVQMLSRHEQERWYERFTCRDPTPKVADPTFLFGFAPLVAGDFICCPKQAQERNYRNKQSQGINYRGSQRNAYNDDINYNSRPNNRRQQNYEQYGNQRSNLKNAPQRVSINDNNNQRRGNIFSQSNTMETNYNQCVNITSFPPLPSTGCCGVDESEREETPGFRRPSRSTDIAQNVTVGNRISGGTATELNQFPWTVLLKTTFAYGFGTQAFNCGGSLISSRYVLTAAHCVHDNDGEVIEVKVYLSEYDKRTFPKDCKRQLAGGPERCTNNVLVLADNVISHPQFDESRLQNDIALLRLQKRVPYTEFIRPICLPPIDIDSQRLDSLPLSVTGWGRAGPHESDIKQYTVVHLVPQTQCKEFYSFLTNRHLCAAGYTGEDTCKGDSGGPLMLYHKGQYYVSGIVSGKRSDSPCGTAVPSLYTNVYTYSEWIVNNIKS